MVKTLFNPRNCELILQKKAALDGAAFFVKNAER